MIREIIFDLGNVLMNFRKNDLLEACEIAPENRDYLWQVFYHSSEREQVDCGLLDYETARQIWISRVPERLQPEMRRLTDWYEHMDEIPEMIELGFALSLKHNRIYLLSNLSETFAEYRHRFSLWGYFDGAVLSFEEHVMKPDPAIYQLLLDRYQLVPEECVFIDDSPENIAAAEKFGITGILYPTDVPYSQATEWLTDQLKQLGVEIWDEQDSQRLLKDIAENAEKRKMEEGK